MDSQDGAAMGSGRVKTIFNMVPTLARVSVRSKKQRRDNGKQAGTRTKKMSKPAHETCLPKHKNSKGCAPTADSC